MHRHLYTLSMQALIVHCGKRYLAKQWCKRTSCWISNRLVVTDTVARVDKCGAVVRSRLADIVIGNRKYLRAIPVAVRSTFSSTSAQLTSSLAMYVENSGSEIYEMLHIRCMGCVYS